ncbi:hypothetical protein [Micromonospora echinofusca]|uniref:hypothetical protein n=1 Tax=Micromonospora echinofusca TaxID=47858 RepID=UPI001AD60F38|nr:hypothetical protein [Micromonospora echinofusca]
MIAVATAVVVALTLAQPVQAADGVEVKNQELQNRLFTSYARLKNPGPNGLRDMMLSADLVGFREKNPYATAEQLHQRMASMRAWYDNNLTAQDLERPAFDYAMKLINLTTLHPAAAQAAPIIRDLLESTMGKDIKTWAMSADYVAGSKFQYTAFSQLYAIQDLIWSRVNQRGSIDSAFRQAWDGAIGAGMNISANATIDQLLADPVIATNVNVQALMDQLANSTAYLQEGQEQLAAKLELISAQNDTTLALMKELDAKYPVAPGAPRPTLAEQQNQRNLAAERQQIIDGAATAIEILSTLLGFADPRAGKIAAGVGKAAVQVATAINNFIPAVAGLGLGEAIFSMSTLTLTGNVLGAITSVLPLFSGVPSPEQVMLDELAKIRQDIATLNTSMHSRFDRLEQGLTNLYGDMINRFDEMMQLQNATNAQLANLETQLLRLMPRLDMWGAEIIKGQQEDILYDTNLMMNKYIDYEQRYGQPIPSYNGGGDRYTEPEGILRTAATTLSTRAPLTGPSTGWSTTDPVQALNTWEPNGALGYLEWYAGNRYGLPTSSTLTKPNPATWSFAARGYGVLALQNPDYAKQVSATETARIISTGQDILTVNRALSKPKTTPGADGKRTNVLFTGLTADYLNAVGDLRLKLSAVRKKYSDDKEYNLFGPLDQALPDAAKLTDPAGVQPCNGTPGYLSRPNNIALTSAPSVFAFAQYAHPDKPTVSLCYDAGMVNIKRSFTTKFYITKADLRVQMRLRVRWGSEVRDYQVRTLTTPLGETCREYKETGEFVFCYALEDYLDNWDAVYKPMFESGATYSGNEQVNTDVRTRMTNFLAGRRAAYYGQVYDDLNNEASDIHKSNAEVTRAVKLLKAYTQLGFGRTLMQDDLLRASLFGSTRIVGDDSDATIVKDTFATALTAYANCNAPARGAPCTAGNGAFDPLAGQRHLTDCVAGGSEEMWDPVGNCIVAKAKSRHGLLTDRYEAASVRIANGDYTEGMPEVEAVITSLTMIDASVRH